MQKNSEQKAWKQTLLVDRKQLDSYSKDIAKLFPFSITVAPWTEKISKRLAEHEQAQVKMNKQQRLTYLKLTQINKDINLLRQILANYEQTNENLVKIQNSSENILGKLQQFRGKMGVSYEELAEEEDQLKDELQLMNKKIEHFSKEEYFEQQKQNITNTNKEIKIWDRQLQKKQMRSVSPRMDQQTSKVELIQQKMKEKEKEVDYIDHQFNNLGKHLGWPQEDHNDFISIWHRGSSNKNYFQIEQQLQAYFSLYTGQQIQEHMNKYIKSRKLIEHKKQIITQFKNLKEQKKIEELKLLNLERDKSKEQKQKEEQRKRMYQEQNEMKGKVNQWKEAKLRQKREEQQRKLQLQEQKKRQDALRRRQRVEMGKQKVQEWRQKQTEKQQSLKRVQSARKPTINKQVEQRIRIRQQQLLLKKLQLLNEKKRQEELQKQKQEKLKQEKYVRYSHVNNKLQHKTAAMKEKQREKFDGKQKKQANTFGGQLLMTGVRATPLWMQGL